MKILIIHSRYKFEGGEEAVVSSEMEMLKRFGHDLVLYERLNKEIEGFSLCGKLNFLTKDIIFSQKTFNEIKELVKREKPDIAHIHNIFFMVSPSVYYALAQSNIPVVQSLHNYRLFCPRGIFYRNGKICEKCNSKNFMPAIINRCFKDSFIITLSLVRMLRFHFRRKTFQNKISSYIASSEFSRDKLIKLGLSEDKMFVKPNFIDLKVEDAKNHERYALFIGRLFDYKGVRTLISACEKFSNFHIKIIGSGPLYKELKNRVRKMSNIELLGRVSGDEKLEYLRGASFLIFPSQCYESMPRIIIEAFACGVPVIASCLGTRTEPIEDGRTGMYFTPGDSQELASKIKWAWQNPEKMREMGREARKKYEEEYTAEKNYEILMNIYRETIENYTHKDFQSQWEKPEEINAYQ